MGFDFGEAFAGRPLKFFWLLDVSDSMNHDGKIASLNQAIRSCIKPMQDVAEDNPEAQMFVRAIKFSSGASWHIAQDTPVESFVWNDLSATGWTAMGEALKLLAKEVTVDKMPERGLPPVFVLITDGQPTDNFDEGLSALLAEPWAMKAVRIAIGIGRDANMEILEKFCSDPEVPPLRADNAASLTNFIRWVSTKVVANVSKPPSQVAGQSSGGNVPLPPPPPPLASAADVW